MKKKKTYLFQPIVPIDRVHKAAHVFMWHLKGRGPEGVDELRPDRAEMKEEALYWVDLETRTAEQYADEDPDCEEAVFEFADLTDEEVDQVVDIIYATIGDRPSSELWLYDYPDDERLEVERHMLEKIEELILEGNTRFILPHAIEAGIERLKAKGLLPAA